MPYPISTEEQKMGMQEDLAEVVRLDAERDKAESVLSHREWVVAASKHTAAMASFFDNHHAEIQRNAELAAPREDRDSQQRQAIQMMSERDGLIGDLSDAEERSALRSHERTEAVMRADRADAQLAALQSRIDNSPVAIMDKREWLCLCAPTEEDFPALYALQGKTVYLVVVE
jgi:hypothetical protein